MRPAHNVVMSYGVLMSKTGHVMVETTGGSGDTDTDTVLDRFQAVFGAAWVPGRLTLTSLHLNYVPSRSGQGVAMLDLNLRDVTTVELSSGRVSKTIGLRTARHLFHVRSLAAPALAQQIASALDQLRKRHRTR
ncbi:hypothetical protein NPS01_29930 [Nocardioides psychrotolerans]|uniref:Uncharacterized protein n=2 Tax=Nocardioides psychrotolerans TaxID=1005945 RepID=A0A1I3GKY8_9ACTN|nr:hypothetical protein NPS01_29930 [Nocardioides psychrotolerans]SFI23892.1 hypothetical protein SAMN05216561_106171 [Nocardioides psychrotolerans]